MNAIPSMRAAAVVVGFSLTASHSIFAQAPLPAIGAQALATGRFDCVVSTVDWDGTPQTVGFASIQFNPPLGILGGQVFSSAPLGVGPGLDRACGGVAEHVAGVAQAQRCTTSAIRNVETVGGNFVDQSWSFDVLCSGNQFHFVQTINTILREVLTTPTVGGQQTLSLRSNEIRESSSSLLRAGH